MRKKHKLYNRIMSVLLAGALIMTSVSVTPLKGGVHAGTAIMNGSTLDLTAAYNFSQDFTFVSTQNGFGVSYNNNYGNDVIDDVASGTNICINTNGTASTSVYIDCAATLGTVEFSTGYAMSSAYLTINPGATLTVNSFSAFNNTGYVSNNGTLVMSTFDTNALKDYSVLGDEGALGFSNSGTISATNISLYKDTMVNGGAGSVYKATNSFYKDSFDLAGTVEVAADTTITSDGGSFTVSLNGAEKTITEAVSGQRAEDLFEELDIIVDTAELNSKDIFIGTDIDEAIESCVSFSDGYAGNWRIAYYDQGVGGTEIDQSSIISHKAYYFKIIADTYGEYWGVESPVYSFTPKFLDMTGVAITISGLKNGVYAQDSISVAPPEGYQIASCYDGEYSDSVEFTYDDLFPADNGRNFYEGLYFTVIRNSDGAYSDSVWWSDLQPDMDSIIFDDEAPTLSGPIYADGEEVEDSESTITADEVTFTISDTNLSSVTVNGTANIIVETQDGNSSDVTIEASEGAAKTYDIEAEDLSGRTLGFTLTIKHTRKTAEATVSVPDTVEGEDYEPTVETDSDGKATFLYKARAITDNDAFSDKKPTAPGTYIVQATIAQTDYYEEIKCENSFTISEKVEEEEPEEEEETTEAPDDEETTEAPAEEEEAETPSDEDPEEPNTELPQGETSAVPKKDATVTVNISDKFYGVEYAPTVTTDSDADPSAVIYQYALKEMANSGRTIDKPTAVGSYTVTAYVPETDNYKKAQNSANFDISYLDAPTTSAYIISGTPGNNDYYVSEVHVNAPTGYEIADSLDGNYSPYLVYSENLRQIFLRRTADGAKTSSIAYTDKDLKIDTIKPALSFSAMDQDGNKVDLSGEFYADTVTFTISDDHLSSVKISDDEGVVKPEIKDNSASVTLDSKNYCKSFTINAEDEAGNTYVASVKIEATWRKTMTIIADEVLPLKTGETYTLGSGSWTVSTSSGQDSTVYVGGNSVCTTSDVDATFTKAGN